MKLSAPAKLNLFLEVIARRRDGYHELATLFAKIDLADDVRVRRLDSPKIELHLTNRSGTPVPSGSANLAVKAAELYRRTFHIKEGVRIDLTKRIPAGGGLGGGSSDAGAVLRAMAALFPGARREKTLINIAKKLGADVPVFTRPEPVLEGRGVGERLKAVRVKKALPWIVLVYPGVSVPTAGAFRRLDVPRRRNALTSLAKLGKMKGYLASGRPADASKLLFNRLEGAVLPFYPAVREAKHTFLSLGAAPMMSGSGSCVFAFAPSRATGQRWARRLKRRGWASWLVRILGHH